MVATPSLDILGPVGIPLPNLKYASSRCHAGRPFDRVGGLIPVGKRFEPVGV
jgi:hypothetical protein